MPADRAEQERVSEMLATRIHDELAVWQNSTARSKQSSARVLGMSDLGACREYLRATIAGEDRVADTRLKWPAFIGTALGDLVERALTEQIEAATQEYVTVTLPSSGIQVSGSTDLVLFDNHLCDVKGLALDTPIPTPSGWTTMGELKVGDEVFDMDGRPVRVTRKSEVKHLRCYEVSTPGAGSVVCDEEHLWWASKNGGPVRVHGVTALAKAHKAYLPVAQPLRLPPAELPLDPWLLGYWLGNGSQTLLSCHDDDAEHVAQQVRAAGFDAKVRSSKVAEHGAAVLVSQTGGTRTPGRGLGAPLSALGLFDSKHIPAIYLRASYEQRVALLRGLMDSDGSWNRKRERATFSVTSERLALGVLELVRSLGLRPQYNVTIGRGFGKTVQVHQIEWSAPFVPFALPRKVELVTFTPAQAVRSGRHRIVVREVSSVPTQCISVDSPTESYLAGHGMIPTHNTKDRLDAVREEGPSTQYLVQLSGYFVGMVQAGRMTEEGTASLVYFDRSGAQEHPYVHTIGYLEAVSYLEWADERLADVAHALTPEAAYPDANGRYLRDQPESFCWNGLRCPFFAQCWGTPDYQPTGVIDAPEHLAAIELYDKGRKLAKTAEGLQREAKSALGAYGPADVDPIEGTTADGKWSLKFTLTEGGRYISRRIDLRAKR